MNRTTINFTVVNADGDDLIFGENALYEPNGIRTISQDRAPLLEVDSANQNMQLTTDRTFIVIDFKGKFQDADIDTLTLAYEVIHESGDCDIRALRSITYKDSVYALDSQGVMRLVRK
ncbi:MAG: hypothetical protein AAFX87_23695 [Bacteroidota bacterium]